MRYLKNFQATFDIGTFVWQMHSRHVCLVRQACTSAHWVKIGALGAHPTVWGPSANVRSSVLDVVWQCLPTLVWHCKDVCGIVSFVSVCTLVWYSAHVCALGRLTKRARGAIW